jgi:prevent-host-death family protein
MAISLAEDIRSVTDLKRHTKNIISQVHRTGRPVVVTVNGRADVVLLDIATYENQVSAQKMAELLAPAEKDIVLKQTRPIKQFLKEFKNAHKV